MTLNLFQSRRNEEEWMDQPSTSPEAFSRALVDIQWVNRNLGGTETMLKTVVQMLPPHEANPIHILDLGTGSADIPLALLRWSETARRALQITAVDLHPVAVAEARQLCKNAPQIQVIQADALHLPYPDQSFDLVISSMFMHHLEDEQAIRLLLEMARMSRTGLIINDLERHPLAWLGIKALGHLTGKGDIFMNDAPLSVLRGFTRPELEALIASAGLKNVEIQHHRPYRWIVRWTREMA